MLSEKIHDSLKEALRAHDGVRVEALRYLQSFLQNAKIEKRGEALTDEEVLGIVRRLIKQGNDSIAQFSQGGRGDLVATEEAQKEVFMAYLPEQMSESDLEGIVAEVIKQTGAESVKDMGKVMKEVMAKVGQKADGATVSALVKEKLSS